LSVELWKKLGSNCADQEIDDLVSGGWRELEEPNLRIGLQGAAEKVSGKRVANVAKITGTETSRSSGCVLGRNV